MMNVTSQLDAGHIQAVCEAIGFTPKEKPDSSGWVTTKSPVRDEKNPSFGFNPTNGGWYDHATGDKGDIIDLYSSLTKADKNKAIQDVKEIAGIQDNPKPQNQQSKIVAEYDYHDETGNLLYQVVRLEPKSFRQRIPDGSGWKWGLGDIRRVIYNLPVVNECIENGWLICLVEGEKDAETLRSLGIAATTAPMGAGKWQKSYTKQLKDAIVMILPDNDKQGRDHANHVATKLHDVAKQVKVVNLPGLDNKQDVSDWINKGGDRKRLIELWQETPDFEPVPETTETPAASWFQPVNPFHESVEPLEFVFEGLAARGMVTLIGGSAGSGKSILVQYITQLRNKQSLIPANTGKGIYLTGLDSSETEIRRRAKSIGAGDGMFTVSIPDEVIPFVSNPEFETQLISELQHAGADTVIFDTLADFHSGNPYEAEDANRTMSAFRRIAQHANCAVILVTHQRKSADLKQKFQINDIADSRIFATKSDFVFALRSEYQEETNLIELQCLKSRSPRPMAPLRASITYDDHSERVEVRQSDELFETEAEAESDSQKREVQRAEALKLSQAGKSYRQIAKELEVSHATVSKLLK